MADTFVRMLARDSDSFRYVLGLHAVAANRAGDAKDQLSAWNSPACWFSDRKPLNRESLFRGEMIGGLCGSCRINLTIPVHPPRAGIVYERPRSN